MDARTPEQCDQLFAERMNGGDLEGLVALYEPEASFVSQDGEVVSGHAGIREAVEGFFVMKPRLRMNVVKTVRVGDELAVLYNNDWTMSVTGPDGKTDDLAGKALEVVRRQRDGSWRFIVDDPFARG